MSSLVTKVIATVVSIGTIGGGVGLGVHLLSNNSTISSKLVSEGFVLASTAQDWTTLLAAHNKLNDPADNVFKEAGTTNKNKEWLQEKCKQALNSKENDKVNYKLARQWCVKETDINNILGKTRKVLDSTNTADDTNHWPKVLENLKKNDKAITALAIGKSDKSTITIGDIKSKCKPLIAIKTTVKEFNEKFELAEEWCSISK